VHTVQTGVRDGVTEFGFAVPDAPDTGKHGWVLHCRPGDWIARNRDATIGDPGTFADGVEGGLADPTPSRPASGN
jgi:hypothetical protein